MILPLQWFSADVSRSFLAVGVIRYDDGILAELGPNKRCLEYFIFNKLCCMSTNLWIDVNVQGIMHGIGNELVFKRWSLMCKSCTFI